MLKKLLIKNYALIRELEIAPSDKLNIVTGETGAGKSIMLGAIGMLMGGRADTKVLFDESRKCIIEGFFDVASYQLDGLFTELDLDYEPETVIRREISPGGKSRAFINDSPVNLNALRQVSARLMDIHSQHDNLQLGANEFQLNLIDIFASNSPLLEIYRRAYQAFTRADSAWRKLQREHREMQQAFDYNTHLLKELNAMPLDDIDQQTLEEELEMLDNAESIKASLNELLELLARSEYAVEGNLKSAGAALGQISGFSQKYAELADRIRSAQIEIADISFEAEKEDASLVLDEERIMLLKEQLDQLYSLQKRHHVNSVEELIKVRDSLKEQVDKVLNFDTELEATRQQLEEARKTVMAEGEKLSAARRGAIVPFVAETDRLLVQLGMPNAQLHILHEVAEPSATGIDHISFLFSANKGVAPDTLRNVASGGEFSRLMLAIKYILAGKTLLPTVVFDEIDTGISGEIAIKMGKMMQEMASRHQLIAISHLPQIAARGDQHYFVYKDDTAERAVSRIRKLDPQERVNEIAQMIGGANPSKVAYQSARELMKK